jgi:hypothetical protein
MNCIHLRAESAHRLDLVREKFYARVRMAGVGIYNAAGFRAVQRKENAFLSGRGTASLT